MKTSVALPVRLLLWIALAGLWAVGCATTPPKVELPASLDIPRKFELTNVPFHPQGKYQCGPASLAMTLQWSGVAVSPEDLKPQVYTASRQGSLPPDMIGAARRHGRVAYPVASVEHILREVAGGHPVIVLQRLSILMQTTWHYAVVIGYDLDRREVVLHSGVKEIEVLSLDAFAETWRPWGRWAILTLSPNRLPVTAEVGVYLKAVVGLEQTQRWGEAEAAYTTAAARWPHHPTAWMGLGNSRYARGNLDGAEQAFRSAVRVAPEAGPAYNNLAHVLMELNRKEEALNVIHQAIRLGGPLADVFRKTLAEILQLKDD